MSFQELKTRRIMQEQIAALQAQAAELAERIKALEERPERRGPGRPKKAADDDHSAD